MPSFSTTSNKRRIGLFVLIEARYSNPTATFDTPLNSLSKSQWRVTILTMSHLAQGSQPLSPRAYLSDRSRLRCPRDGGYEHWKARWGSIYVNVTLSNYLECLETYHLPTAGACQASSLDNEGVLLPRSSHLWEALSGREGAQQTHLPA
jgi:hypothetical protein